MSKSTRHTVTAPLVVIPGPAGDRYCYRGDQVPDDTDPALLQRLVGRNLVKPIKQRITRDVEHDSDED